MNENIFDKLDFGPFRSLLDDDDITDISYDNNGQIWVRSLTQGSMRVEIEGATPEFVEKLAFQCSNVMGTTFNNAKPFLDAESAELRMNFVHQSIATNGIALVIRKTPAKIRLEKEKLLREDYFTEAIHDFLMKCVQGHCNIMVAGETGSGKTEFVKYLASHTNTNEKIITIEDTLELHLDKIYPQRDIVAMKTNNVASYSDVLVTCMRQNPKWILLSEVRSAEAVSAVRNSISSGHNILSTIHADKASAIPYRLYSLMETDLDVHQFLTTIYRYIQLGVHIKAFYSKEYGKFHRELDEVCEFYVDDNNEPKSRIIYQKLMGKMMMCKPSAHLREYLENQNIDIWDIIKDLPDELPITEFKDDRKKEENKSEETNNEVSKGEDVSSDNTTTEKVAADKLPEDEAETDREHGAEFGDAESTPVINGGNVQLSDSVVDDPKVGIIDGPITGPVTDEANASVGEVIANPAPVNAPVVNNTSGPVSSVPEMPAKIPEIGEVPTVPQQQQPVLSPQVLTPTIPQNAAPQMIAPQPATIPQMIKQPVPMPQVQQQPMIQQPAMQPPVMGVAQGVVPIMQQAPIAGVQPVMPQPVNPNITG